MICFKAFRRLLLFIPLLGPMAMAETTPWTLVNLTDQDLAFQAMPATPPGPSLALLESSLLGPETRPGPSNPVPAQGAFTLGPGTALTVFLEPGARTVSFTFGPGPWEPDRVMGEMTMTVIPPEPGETGAATHGCAVTLCPGAEVPIRVDPHPSGSALGGPLAVFAPGLADPAPGAAGGGGPVPSVRPAQAKGWAALLKSAMVGLLLTQPGLAIDPGSSSCPSRAGNPFAPQCFQGMEPDPLARLAPDPGFPPLEPTLWPFLDQAALEQQLQIKRNLEHHLAQVDQLARAHLQQRMAGLRFRHLLHRFTHAFTREKILGHGGQVQDVLHELLAGTMPAGPVPPANP